MSSSLRLTIDDYEQMIASGAFDRLGKRLEFIHGELRETNPAGPYHFDYINFLKPLVDNQHVTRRSSRSDSRRDSVGG